MYRESAKSGMGGRRLIPTLLFIVSHFPLLGQQRHKSGASERNNRISEMFYGFWSKTRSRQDVMFTSLNQRHDTGIIGGGSRN